MWMFHCRLGQGEFYLGLLFITRMVRIISAPFVVVALDAIGAMIMRDSSEFTDLLLLRLPSDRPLE